MPPKSNIFVSQQAFIHVMSHELETIHESTPDGMKPMIDIDPDAYIDTQGVCNGVVHPITKEAITSYRKCMNDPHLRDIWTKVMAKKGTNTA